MIGASRSLPDDWSVKLEQPLDITRAHETNQIVIELASLPLQMLDGTIYDLCAVRFVGIDGDHKREKQRYRGLCLPAASV